MLASLLTQPGWFFSLWEGNQASQRHQSRFMDLLTHLLISSEPYHASDLGGLGNAPGPPHWVLILRFLRMLYSTGEPHKQQRFSCFFYYLGDKTELLCDETLQRTSVWISADGAC